MVTDRHHPKMLGRFNIRSGLVGGQIETDRKPNVVLSCSIDQSIAAGEIDVLSRKITVDLIFSCGISSKL